MFRATERKLMNFLCMLMEDCNGILHGEDSSLGIGDTSGLGYKKQIASS